MDKNADFRSTHISTRLFGLVAAFFCLFSHPALSVELTGNQKHLALYESLSYLEDNSKELSIEQVLSKPFASVDSVQGRNLAFGYSESAYWIKFDVVNNTSMSDWLIEVGYPILDEVDMYLVKDGSLQAQYKTGDHLPFAERPFSHRNFLFPLEIRSSEKVSVYLRVVSTSSVRIPLHFWEKQHFFEQDQFKLAGQGIYFGILIIMMLYNLFIFFSIKEKAYLHYVFYVASYIIVQASLNGVGYQFFIPDWVTLNDKAIVYSLSLVILFGCSFSVNFLNLKFNHRLANQIIQFIGLLGGLNFVLALFLPYSFSIKTALLLAVTGSLAITAFGLLLWLRNGVREARFFSIAWVGFLVGSVLMMLNRIQIIPDNFFTENAAQLGSSFEVMLLSFALADKFSQMRGEKEKVEHKAKKSLKQVNALLTETLKRLENSNKIKNNFLATVSHELRTPMNGIIGANELLSASPLSDEAKDYLNISQASAEHMMRLVESMLQFVDLQAGLSDVKKESIDIDCLIGDLEVYVLPKIETKNIRFDSSIQVEEDTSFYCDYKKLNTVLEILLDNATKYTHSGSIRLNVKPKGKGVLADIEFHVIDTGIGIDKHHLNEIFDAFQQVDSSNKRSYSGLGMGLTVARSLANVLGGDIRVKSKVGKGSEFILSLPLYNIDD